MKLVLKRLLYFLLSLITLNISWQATCGSHTPLPAIDIPKVIPQGTLKGLKKPVLPIVLMAGDIDLPRHYEPKMQIVYLKSLSKKTQAIGQTITTKD